MGNSPSKSGEDPSDQKQCIKKVNYLFFFSKDIDSSIHCFFLKILQNTSTLLVFNKVISYESNNNFYKIVCMIFAVLFQLQYNKKFAFYLSELITSPQK